VRKKFIALVFFSLATAAGVHAQQPFQAVIAGDHCDVILVYQPVLQWIDPDRTEAHSPVSAIASGDHRRVFGVVNSFAGAISELRPDGSKTPFFTLGSRISNLTVASDAR